MMPDRVVRRQPLPIAPHGGNCYTARSAGYTSAACRVTRSGFSDPSARRSFTTPI
jgi:hypothetical protein